MAAKVAAAEGSEIFHHSPLDLEERSIRLLRLIGGSSIAIPCEIFEATLDDDDLIEYDALSYTWGSEETSEAVHIDGKRKAVTSNLYEALYHLCRNEDVFLWVDSLCINQQDNDERSHQVRHMASIYKKAERVLVWLGASCPSTDHALMLINDFWSQANKLCASSWGADDPRWTTLWNGLVIGSTEQESVKEGITLLLRNPWFSRVWVLQEISYARRATIVCGSKCCPAAAFGLAPRLATDKLSAHQESVLDVFPGPSRQTSWWRTKRDLGTILYRFRHCEASNDLDRIYALLNLCSTVPESQFLPVDYNKDLGMVITDTAKCLLESFSPHRGSCSFGRMYDPFMFGSTGLLRGETSLRWTLQHFHQFMLKLANLAAIFHPDGHCTSHDAEAIYRELYPALAKFDCQQIRVVTEICRDDGQWYWGFYLESRPTP